MYRPAQQPITPFPSPVPLVTCGCGRAYGQARLSEGTASLDLTRAWLSSAVKGFLSADASEGGTGDAGERARRAKGLRDGREVRGRNVYSSSHLPVHRSSTRQGSTTVVCSSVQMQTLVVLSCVVDDPVGCRHSSRL